MHRFLPHFAQQKRFDLAYKHAREGSPLRNGRHHLGTETPAA